jgi:hypothetical protein
VSLFRSIFLPNATCSSVPHRQAPYPRVP